MSKESEYHIDRSDAVFATVSGALIGAGTVIPPLVGLGVAIGAVGVFRVKSHERDQQLRQLSHYLSLTGNDSSKKERGENNEDR